MIMNARIDDFVIDEDAQPLHAFGHHYNDFVEDWRDMLRDYREENALIRRRFAEMEQIVQARHQGMINFQAQQQEEPPQQQQQQQPQTDDNNDAVDAPIEPVEIPESPSSPVTTNHPDGVIQYYAAEDERSAMQAAALAIAQLPQVNPQEAAAPAPEQPPQMNPQDAAAPQPAQREIGYLDNRLRTD